jgi:hypothetical protein
MCGLDIARMIVPPPSAHSFRILMVGDDVGIIGEVLVANRADAALFSDLPVHQFPHLGRGSQLPVSPRVMRIFNSLNSKSDQLWFGKKFTSAARKRSMNRTQFICTESHGRSPAVLGLACEGVQSEVAKRRNEERSSSSCISIPRACDLAGSKYKCCAVKSCASVVYKDSLSNGQPESRLYSCGKIDLW